MIKIEPYLKLREETVDDFKLKHNTCNHKPKTFNKRVSWC